MTYDLAASTSDACQTHGTQLSVKLSVQVEKLQLCCSMTRISEAELRTQVQLVSGAGQGGTCVTGFLLQARLLMKLTHA